MTASNAFLWAYVFKPALIVMAIYYAGYVFAYLMGWKPEMSRHEKYKELESDIYMRQMKRTQEKIALLSAMRKTPVDQRECLWERFHTLDAKDKEFTRDERDQLVAASGFTIDEREQYELDNGINPYRRSDNG